MVEYSAVVKSMAIEEGELLIVMEGFWENEEVEYLIPCDGGATEVNNQEVDDG
jgi:hypothetical protein